ncbi:MAG: SRPBCC family protein [Solirubrobacteraceae bacterium]
MPTVERTRTIAASPQELWEVVGDPHHLPRWWPRVQRVEAVRDGAFTEVLMSPKGKMVRADFKLLDTPEPWRVVWSQQVENTPFARVLKSAETEIRLQDGHGTHGPLSRVTIEMRQATQGFFARLGSRLVGRAAASTIEEALDGLELIAGGETQV